MATWVAPIESQTDPDAPITSELGKRWDNNVIAAFEGASGAPRLDDEALGASATADGSVWVRARLALANGGLVGTLCFATHVGSGNVAFNQIVNGSVLQPSGAAGESGSGALSGTWRCLGLVVGTSLSERTTLWIRVT